jgi:uncharacterized protein
MTSLFTEVGQAAKAPSGLVPFRFREVSGDYLLTNFLGDWVFVTQDEMRSLARGELQAGTPLHDKLAARNFLRDSIDVAKTAERVSRKKRF